MRFKKPDIIPSILLLAIAAYVLYVSYFSGTYLEPDSANYLREAKVLLAGNGFNLDAGAGAHAYFAVWPIGYPALLAAVSFLTGANIVLASKMLSILILLLIIVSFKRRFSAASPVVSLAVFNLAFLRIFSYPLSEQPFLLGMIWFCFALYDFFAVAKPTFLRSLNLGAAGLFLFAIRYSGVFAVFVPGLIAALFWARKNSQNDPRRKRSFRLFAVAAILLIQAGVIAVYLFQNQSHTGFLTGMPRIPPAEPFPALLFDLFKAELIEIGVMIIPFLLAGVMIGIPGLRGLFKIKPAWAYLSDIRRPGFYFVSTGAFYWLFVVAVRFTNQLDEFGYRLLHPATILISIALLGYIADRRKDAIPSRLGQSRIIYAVVFPILMILYMLPGLKAVRGKAPAFYVSQNQSERRTLEEYKGIPPGSLIIFGDDLARVVRLDLLFENPKFAPYHQPEAIDEFFARCRARKPDAGIFLNSRAITDAFYVSKNPRYDESIYLYFRELSKSEGQFTEIRYNPPLPPFRKGGIRLPLLKGGGEGLSPVFSEGDHGGLSAAGRTVGAHARWE